MTHFTKCDTTNKDGFIHLYSDISEDSLENQVHELMLSKGYKLKEGEEGNGVYTKGNRIARLLLGAFYKYFKWQIHTRSKGEFTSLEFTKESSGMSGGMIGVNQVKKELQNMSNMMQTI